MFAKMFYMILFIEIEHCIPHLIPNFDFITQAPSTDTQNVIAGAAPPAIITGSAPPRDTQNVDLRQPQGVRTDTSPQVQPVRQDAIRRYTTNCVPRD